jgi:histidine triad (HIT) family protein
LEKSSSGSGCRVDCIFCRIVRGEVPAHKVYEDRTTVAFLDAHPQARGHTLVVPKRHSVDLFHAPESDICDAFAAAKKVALAMRAALGAEGVNVLHASGEAAGQSVFHLHIHVLPRHGGDGLHAFPEAGYAEDDFASVAERLRRAI